jgi:hypothetical protein
MADDIKPLGDDPGTPLVLKAEAVENAVLQSVSFGTLRASIPTDRASDSILDVFTVGTMATAKIQALQQGRFAPTTQHKQLRTAVALLDKQIEMLGGVRDKDDGGFHLSNPQNVVAVGAAIRDKLSELDKTIAAAGSWIPDSVRFGAKADKYFAAQSDREQFAAADVELQHSIKDQAEKMRTAAADKRAQDLGAGRTVLDSLIRTAAHDLGVATGIVPLSVKDVKDSVQFMGGSKNKSAGSVELGQLKPAAVPMEAPTLNNPKAR